LPHFSSSWWHHEESHNPATFSNWSDDIAVEYRGMLYNRHNLDTEKLIYPASLLFDAAAASKRDLSCWKVEESILSLFVCVPSG
jgi:hypothetical protein